MTHDTIEIVFKIHMPKTRWATTRAVGDGLSNIFTRTALLNILIDHLEVKGYIHHDMAYDTELPVIRLNGSEKPTSPKPTVKPIEPAPQIDVRANKEWLTVNRETYRGKWVAIHNGSLIAASLTLYDLTAEVVDVKGKGILITKVS